MAQVQPTRRAEHAPDELAFKIAADQWGHISRRQALECGLTPRQIQQRTTRGGWKTVHPGVYRLPDAPVSWKGRVQAALLWAGPDALLCGRTAAYLLGLEGIEQPHDIDILTTASTPVPGVRIHRRRAGTTRRRNAGGFPACEVEQILIQVAAELPARRVGMALDSALRGRLTTVERVKQVVSMPGNGRNGVASLRRLVAARDANDEKIRSAFEAKMLQILRRMKGLKFTVDHPVVVDGERFDLDFFVPSGPLGIECHSFWWHVTKQNDDVRRERKIRSAGIDLIYFTWDDVTFDAAGVERALWERLRGLCSGEST